MASFQKVIVVVLSVAMLQPFSLQTTSAQEPTTYQFERLDEDLSDGLLNLVSDDELEDPATTLTVMDRRIKEIEEDLIRLVDASDLDQYGPVSPATVESWMQDHRSDQAFFPIVHLILVHQFLQRQRLEVELHMIITAQDQEAVVGTAIAQQRLNQAAMIFEVGRFDARLKQMVADASAAVAFRALPANFIMATVLVLHLRELHGFITQFEGQRALVQSLPHHSGVGGAGSSLLKALETAKAGEDGTEVRRVLAQAIDNPQIDHPNRRADPQERPNRTYHGSPNLRFNVNSMARREMAIFRSESLDLLRHLESVSTGDGEAKRLVAMLEDIRGPFHMGDSNLATVTARERAALMWKSFQIEGVLKSANQYALYGDNAAHIRENILPHLRARHAKIARILNGDVPMSPFGKAVNRVAILNEVTLLGLFIVCTISAIRGIGDKSQPNNQTAAEFAEIERAFATMKNQPVSVVYSQLERAREITAANRDMIARLYDTELPVANDVTDLGSHLSQVLTN